MREMRDFQAGFLIGILWTIGMFVIEIFNNKITDGNYASGIGILLMGIWLVVALGLLTVKFAERGKDE